MVKSGDDLTEEQYNTALHWIDCLMEAVSQMDSGKAPDCKYLRRRHDALGALVDFYESHKFPIDEPSSDSIPNERYCSNCGSMLQRVEVVNVQTMKSRGFLWACEDCGNQETGFGEPDEFPTDGGVPANEND